MACIRPRWTSPVFLLAASLFGVQSFIAPVSQGRQSSSALCSTTSNDPAIRFLGKGPRAIIRPGIVLVAPKEEFHHFYRQAAIFIYAMGEDEDYDNKYMIRAAIIDHPTPFTLGEMADSSFLEAIKDNPMASNLIYRGGDKGGDNVFMLHNQQDIGDGDMIGTSGIFQGGLQEALKACERGSAKPGDFKFFFNFCQFTEEELESMLDDDPWIAVEVPSEYVLNADWDRGDCWRQLRNAIREETDA
jgi:putative AlgH/UPF0301 family transcriptional regulator